MNDTLIIGVLGFIGTALGVFASWRGTSKTAQNTREEAEDKFNLESVKSASEEWRELYRNQAEAIKKLNDDMKTTNDELKKTQRELGETKELMKDLVRSRDAYKVIAERLLIIVEWVHDLDVLAPYWSNAPEPVTLLIAESNHVLEKQDSNHA